MYRQKSAFYRKKIFRWLSILVTLAMVFQLFIPVSAGMAENINEDNSIEQPEGSPSAPAPTEGPGMQTGITGASDGELKTVEIPIETGDGKPRQIIVKLKDGVSTQNMAGTMKAAGVDSGPEGQGSLPQLVQVGPGTDMQSALDTLRGDRNVEYAEPNYEVHAFVENEANSSSVSGQLYPDSVKYDEKYADQWGLTEIQAAQAWDSAAGIVTDNDPLKAAPVKIAVLDTGVDADHEDLTGRVITITGCSFLEGVKGSNADDDSVQGHGTHVAGIAAAKTGNVTGIAGAAGEFPVSILPIKVLDKNGYGTMYDVALGIREAVDQGAKVINLSLGGRMPDFPRTLGDAVQYAQEHNVLVIAAAGNENGEYVDGIYPACLPWVIPVAATDKNHQRADFSNEFNWQHPGCFAPGVDILSTLPEYTGNKYGTLSGTSMATPFVSGMAAVLMSSDPGKTPAEVRTALLNGYQYDTNNVFSGYVAYNKLQNITNVIEEKMTLVEPLDLNTRVSGTVNIKVSVTKPQVVEQIILKLFSDENSREAGPVFTQTVKREESTNGLYSFSIDTTKHPDGDYWLEINGVTVNKDGTGQPIPYEYGLYYNDFVIANATKSGLEIQVLKPDGKPASGTPITIHHIYKSGDELIFEKPELPYTYDDDNLTTDMDGKLIIPGSILTDGNDYLVTARGTEPNFFYYKVIHSPQGELVKLDDSDTQTFTITGKQKDGGPLAYATVFLDWRADNFAGNLYPEGEDMPYFVPLVGLDTGGSASVTLTKGLYDLKLIGTGSDNEFYYLSERDIQVADNTGNVDFTATGGVTKLQLAPDPGLSDSSLYLTEKSEPYWLGFGEMGEDTPVYVTPGTYYAEIETFLKESNPIKWEWSLDTPDMDLVGGEDLSLQYGVPVNVSMKPRDTTKYPDYKQGDYIGFDVSLKDKYGNMTTNIIKMDSIDSAANSLAAGGALKILKREKKEPVNGEEAANIQAALENTHPDTFLYNPSTGNFEVIASMVTYIYPELEVKDEESNTPIGNKYTYYYSAGWYTYVTDTTGKETYADAGQYALTLHLNAGPITGGGDKTSDTFTINLGVREQEPDPAPAFEIMAKNLNGDPLSISRAVVYRKDDSGYVPIITDEQEHSNGIIDFQYYYLEEGGEYAVAVYGNSPEPGDQQKTSPVFLFKAFEGPSAGGELPFTVILDASSDMRKVTLSPLSKAGDPLTNTCLDYYVYGYGSADQQSPIGFWLDYFYYSSESPMTLWVKEGDYTFQAFTKYDYNPSYFMSRDVDVASDMNIELGGSNLVSLALDIPYNYNPEKAKAGYEIQGLALFSSGKPMAPVLKVYFNYTDEDKDKVYERAQYPVYVSPGTYRAEAVLSRYHFDGVWNYWLVKDKDLEAKTGEPCEFSMDDLFSIAPPQLDRESKIYNPGDELKSSNEIIDSKGNRLVGVKVYQPYMSSAGTEDGQPVEVENHTMIAPFLVITDSNGKELLREKDEGSYYDGLDDWRINYFTPGSLSANSDESSSSSYYNTPIMVYPSGYDGTYYEAYVEIPEGTAGGAYSTRVELGAGPDGMITSEPVGFAIGNAFTAPHLDQAASPTKDTQVTITGSAVSGAAVNLQYVLNGGAPVNAGSTTANDAGAFSLTVNLTAQGTYVFTAVAIKGGLSSEASNSVTVVADRTAPARPAAPAATAALGGIVNLTWNAVADNVAVAGYEVYRSVGTGAESLIGTTQTCSYRDTGLTANTDYSYTIVAYDQAENRSAHSPAVKVKTLPMGIRSVNYRVNRLYYNGPVAMGSPVSITMAGERNCTASAVITYKTWLDESGNTLQDPRTASATISLTEGKDQQGVGNGTYRGQYDIAAGVLELNSVEGILSDGQGNQVNQSAAINPAIKVTGRIAVTVDVPAGTALNATLYVWDSVKNSAVASQQVNIPGASGEAGALDAAATVMFNGIEQGGYVLKMTDSYGMELLKGDIGKVVDVVNGLETPWTITPAVPANLKVRITDADGTQVKGVSITLTDTDTKNYLGSVQIYENAQDGWSDTIGRLLKGQHVTAALQYLDDSDSEHLYKVFNEWPLTLDEVSNEKTLVLHEFTKGTLSGKVTNPDGSAAEGIKIAVSQTEQNSWRSFTRYAVTDDKGNYSIQIAAGLNADVRASSPNNGLIITPSAITRSVAEGGSATADFQISSLKRYVLALNLYTKYPGDADWVKTTDINWRLAVHYYMYVSGENGGSSSVTSDKVTVIGAPGEKFTVHVDGRQGNLPVVDTKVVLPLDNTNEIPVDIRLGQTGARFVGQVTKEDGTRTTDWTGYLYKLDGNGGQKLVQTFSEVNEWQERINYDLDVTVSEDGDYLILMKSVSDGGGLACTQQVTLDSDKTKDVGKLVLHPSGSFNGQQGNGLTVTPGTAVPGGLLTLRAAYKNGGSTTLENCKLYLEIPEGTTLNGSVTLNGQPVDNPTVTGSACEVPVGALAGQASGAAVYQVLVDDDITKDKVTAAARMKYGTDGEEMIGTAQAVVLRISISVPVRTSLSSFRVGGRAPSGLTVQVFSDSDFVGETVASPNGYWSLNINIPGWASPSRHMLYAQSVDKTDPDHETIYKSTSAQVLYDTAQVELTGVSMQQVGYDVGGRKVTFDPRNGVARFPYVIVPGVPFEIGLNFSNPDNVSDVEVRLGDYSSTAQRVTGGQSGGPNFAATVNIGGWGGVGALAVTYKVKPAGATFENVKTPTLAGFSQLMPYEMRGYKVEEITPPSEGGDTASVSFSIPGANQNANPEDNPERDLNVNVSVTVQASDFVPDQEDLDEAAESGVPVYDFTLEDPVMVNGNMVIKISGYMPESYLKAAGANTSALLLAAANGTPLPDSGWVKAAGGESALKVVAEVALQGYDSGSSLKDGFGVPDKFSELGSLLDQSLDCPHAGALKIGIDHAANKLMTGEAAKWGLMLAGTLLGPETFGIGTVVLFAAGKAVEWAIDRSVDKTINEIKAQLADCKKPKNDRDRIADPTWIWDPSGYVYEEGDTTQRIEGVKTTALENVDGTWVSWDAEWYGQENPMYSDSQGKYGWDVPQGEWKVLYEKDGYLTVESDPMQVPPPQTEVNIGMRSLAVPQVQSINGALSGSYIDVAFDKPMIAAGFSSRTIRITHGTGEDAEFVDGTLTAISPFTDKAGVQLAELVRFTPAAALTAGETYTVSVSRTLQSSAGQFMAQDVARDITIAVPVASVTVSPKPLTLYVGDTQNLTAAITPENATDKAVTWSTDNNGVAGVEVINSVTAKVTAKSAGTATITVTTHDGGKTAACQVTVSTRPIPGTDPTPGTNPSPGGFVNVPSNDFTQGLSSSAQTVSAFDGAIVFNIPEGAFPAGTTLTVKKVTGQVSTGGLRMVIGSDIYEIDAGGAQPLKPITVTVKFDPAKLGGIDPAKLGLYRQDDKDPSIWNYVNGSVDTAAGTLTAVLDHFSRYAVFGYDRTFSDIKGHKFQKEIELLAGRHIVDGTGGDLFNPNGSITRAEVAKILVMAMMSDPGSGIKLLKPDKPTFSDVSRDAWYYTYVETAAAHGIVLGSYGKFHPGDRITRQELAAMVMRILYSEGDIKAAAIGKLNCTDAGKVAAWASAYMNAALQRKLMDLDSAGNVRPLGYATRAEASAAIAKAMDQKGWVHTPITVKGKVTINEIEGRHYEISVSGAGSPKTYVLLPVDSRVGQLLENSVNKEAEVTGLVLSGAGIHMRGTSLTVLWIGEKPKPSLKS